MVNIYKLKLTVLQQEILRFLFMKPDRSFNARGLAMALEVSHPAISKALPLLEKQGYITIQKDKESKRLSIKLDRDNPLVMGLKRSENLKLIYESGLAQFLYESFPGATIILFGSYSLGEDAASSDIDIAIIGAKEKKLELEEFSKFIEKAVALHYFLSFKDISKNLRNNILNGIVLKGAVEL